MMILLVDNYDSFVYNLRRYLVRLGQTVDVVRNDAIDFQAVEGGKYKAIVISPGPKGPDQAGGCLKLVARMQTQLPILGICLGHQILWQAFGGRVVRSLKPMHGRACNVRITAHSELLSGLTSPFSAARYHSLMVDPHNLPSELKITAITEDGVVMAFEHQALPLFGLQFHPESVLTDVGYPLLGNFLKIADGGNGVETQGFHLTLPSSDLVLAKVEHNLVYDQSNDVDLDGPPIAVIPGIGW